MSSDSVYAKPVAPRIIVRPALASVVLHALILAAMTFKWMSTETEVVKVEPAPRVINARLVDVSEIRRPKQPAPVETRKPAPRAERKPATPVARPKPRSVAQAKPKVPAARPKPAAPAKSKPEPKPEPKITREELAAIARADLARALAEEEQALEAAATAGEMAASYAALIQQTVINYWSRPPSARNGMEALLQIQLIPTGDVVSVKVLESSGSAAFDRSAVNAVEKAGSFPELQNLPYREFDQNFRRFRLLFRPEDLRY